MENFSTSSPSFFNFEKWLKYAWNITYFNLIQFKTFSYDIHSDYHIVHMSIQGYPNENLLYISQTKSIYVT